MLRRLTTAIAAIALTFGGLIVATAPASANTQVPCPGNIYSGWDNANKRGTKVDEYWLGQVAVTVFRVDDRYEVFTTDGNQMGRSCSREQPKRPAAARDKYAHLGGGGGGGGGGAAIRPGFGGPGGRLYPFPPGRTGTVTVGQPENAAS